METPQRRKFGTARLRRASAPHLHRRVRLDQRDRRVDSTRQRSYTHVAAIHRCTDPGRASRGERRGCLGSRRRHRPTCCNQTTIRKSRSRCCDKPANERASLRCLCCSKGRRKLYCLRTACTRRRLQDARRWWQASGGCSTGTRTRDRRWPIDRANFDRSHQRRPPPQRWPFNFFEQNQNRCRSARRAARTRDDTRYDSTLGQESSDSPQCQLEHRWDSKRRYRHGPP